MKKAIKYLEVKQGINSLYICVLSAEFLSKVCSNDNKDNWNDTVYQRKLSKIRLNRISNYLQDSNALLPTSVVLNSKQPLKFVNGLIEIDEDDDKFFIIDGQHRIFGTSKNNPDYELSVVLVDCVDVEMQSELFITINSEQKKVNSNVRFNMMSNSKVMTPEKMVFNIISMLNKSEESPFYNLIKMDDTTFARDDFKISLSSFASPIVNYIYSASDYYDLKKSLEEHECFNGPSIDIFINYNNKYKNKILWDMYCNNSYDLIYRILLNYFSAMRMVFNNKWARNDSIICKTTGYNAMMFLFKDIFSECKMKKDFSKSTFYKRIIGLNEIENELTAANYGLGLLGSQKLYTRFKHILDINSDDYSYLSDAEYEPSTLE